MALAHPAAEAAGLSASDVAAQAVQNRPLDGARDVAAVIDARIRQATGALPPAPWRTWAESVPDGSDPEMQAFLRELATAMDGRRQRIGEFTAETSPEWAIAAFGPVPSDPVDRLGWESRAAHVGASSTAGTIRPSHAAPSPRATHQKSAPPGT